MKKFILLIPLMLAGCSNNNIAYYIAGCQELFDDMYAGSPNKPDEKLIVNACERRANVYDAKQRSKTSE